METKIDKKEKRNKIIYWIFTLWMCLGMTASGIVQFVKAPEQVDMITHLGYPLYFLSFLAVMKFLGVITVLAPGFPLLKEWAYAGFFFTMLGALYSHLVLADPFKETFPPILLLVLIGISWYFRPSNRKINQPQIPKV
jgi:hypothetical protein